MQNVWLVVLVSLVIPTFFVHSQPVTDGQGDVGIGTFAPHPSAILDIASTSKGLLIPTLTTTQRDAIQGPATGLVIYNRSDSAIQINCGDEFRPIWCSVIQTNQQGDLSAPLNPGSIWYGGADSMAAELSVGTPGQVLIVNPAGTTPEWISLSSLDFWALGGNTGLSSNILGTLDATSIDIHTNNTSRMTVDGLTGEVAISSGLELIGPNTAFELNGDAGTANQLLQSGGPGTTPTWSSDLSVTNLTIQGSLSGAGPNRFAGSIPIPLGVFQMTIPFPSIQAGAAVNVSVIDGNAAIGVVPIRVTGITPGVGFAVEFTVNYDSPTGSVHYVVVNP